MGKGREHRQGEAENIDRETQGTLAGQSWEYRQGKAGNVNREKTRPPTYGVGTAGGGAPEHVDAMCVKAWLVSWACFNHPLHFCSCVMETLIASSTSHLLGCILPAVTDFVPVFLLRVTGPAGAGVGERTSTRRDCGQQFGDYCEFQSYYCAVEGLSSLETSRAF